MSDLPKVGNCAIFTDYFKLLQLKLVYECYPKNCSNFSNIFYMGNEKGYQKLTKEIYHKNWPKERKPKVDNHNNWPNLESNFRQCKRLPNVD